MIGDVDDEPFQISSFPYSHSSEYVYYTNNYGTGFSISNYMQAEDIVYSFTTTENQMYVDASVEASYAGSFAPKPGIALINEKPSTFDKYYPDLDVELATGYDTWIASFSDGYCYAAQTYYLVVDKWTDYSCHYELNVNLYRQHDFKAFSFESLNVNGEIDYNNRIVTLTVPKGTDLSSLVATYVLPANTEVQVNDITQTSGSTVVDFTNDVTYTINQTVNPFATQTWTIKVAEDISSAITDKSNTTITVSPNPASTMIQVLGDGATVFDKITIFNTSGVKVISKENYKAGQPIDIESLASGIYIVKTEISNTQKTSRFIKK